MRRIRIVMASELPNCPCCDEEKYCKDCPCVGPHNADELGYDVVEEDGKLYGVKRPGKRGSHNTRSEGRK